MKTTTKTEPDAARLVALRALPYAQYLDTPEWRRRRDRALTRAGWCCEWPDCRIRKSLQVHHTSYENLGEEHDEDLQVLCPAHHAQRHETLETLRRRHWLVLRDVIAAGPFESLADFFEAVKVRFHELRIAIDPYDLNELLSVALRDVAIDVPRVGAYLPPTQAPIVSRVEAIQILYDLGMVGAPVREMPRAILVRPSQLDRLKALRMVIEEIAATQARCDALEAMDV